MTMRKKGSVFIAIGLLFLAAALLLTIYNLWDAHRADVAAQATVQALKTMIPAQTQEPTPTEPQEPPQTETQAELTEEPTEESTEEAEEEPPEETQEPDKLMLPLDKEMPTVEWEGYQYIGMLEVPSLELSLPVMDQWDYDRLKISPCRFAGNLYQDDLVVCAHNYAHHFTPLKYVPIGTEIQFTDAEGNLFRYAVSSFDTVGSNEVEKMIKGDWDLTLFTCDTNGQTRIAIRCDRIQ